MSTKYRKILQELESDILAGKYNQIKKLPTEEDLINQYQVSRTTIRKAISILVSKGYVYQIQGSGIFLRESALKGYLSLESLKGLTRDYPNKKVESNVIELKLVQADEQKAAIMKCNVDSPLYFLKRVRLVDGNPLTVEYTYFNKKVIPYMSEEIAKKSIYSYIIDDLGHNIGFADKVIYADKLDEENAQYFHLQQGEPALIIESTEFLSTGEIFAISTSVHNYKSTKLLKLSNF